MEFIKDVYLCAPFYLSVNKIYFLSKLSTEALQNFSSLHLLALEKLYLVFSTAAVDIKTFRCSNIY